LNRSTVVKSLICSRAVCSGGTDKKGVKVDEDPVE
jgi:hypothetical protein